ncbi:MAG: discoidin domain-containing protein, partial [Pirellulaceae bacterium]|nr:discoidin domain-containing protein [Pirellulaceae bacterium]
MPLILPPKRRTPLILAILAYSLLSAMTGATAQTYSASSEERENLSAARAFDGNTSTRWSASFKAKTGWIQVEYPDDRSFAQIRLLNGIRDEKGAPKDFAVLAGASEEKLKEVCNVKGNSSGDRTVKFKKTTARIWRVRIDSLINGRWSPTLTEVKLGTDGAVGEKNAS